LDVGPFFEFDGCGAVELGDDFVGDYGELDAVDEVS
jgi:hypothetical protein